MGSGGPIVGPYTADQACANFIIETAPQSVIPGSSSLAITIEAQDTNTNCNLSAAGVPVALTSTSGTGIFSLTPGGVAITSINLDGPVGSDNTDHHVFYYRDTTTATITANATFDASDPTQVVTVLATKTWIGTTNVWATAATGHRLGRLQVVRPR